jgi:uncharacterized protein with PIN domain
MKILSLRFYEELNDFLPVEKRKKRFEHKFLDRTSVKDLIESLGVPHTEVDLILVNGVSVGFSYLINDKDDISVYPLFESFNISDVQHLRNEPLRNPKFVSDVHLGTLARYLRMTGFDTKYNNNFTTNDIIKISFEEKRTILTRDKNLLKRNDVSRGYWIRNEMPVEQLKEIFNRFHLKGLVKEFSLCLICNNPLIKIEREKIISRIPEKAAEYHRDFSYCTSCDKVYWPGTHYQKMKSLISELN